MYCKGVKVYSFKTSSSYIIIVLCTQHFSSNSCVCAMRIQIIYIMNCSFLVHMWCAINTMFRSLMIYFISCEVTASLLPYPIHQISKINKIENWGYQVRRSLIFSLLDWVDDVLQSLSFRLFQLQQRSRASPVKTGAFGSTVRSRSSLSLNINASQQKTGCVFF